MVKTASRMVSAISFGVFCRLAPSTRLIMRSRKVLPGSAVMRTTIRSESTLVPPVTADRSPPDSRMTGADSPVMADSSTEATPSTISPSEGMASPASHTTRSPFTRAAAGTSSSVPSGARRRAWVSERILRSVSACALPRPSAMASAKLAKMTVRNSHTVMDQSKSPGWAIDSIKVTTVPIRTTNITGFLSWVRGSSFLNEPTRAVFRIWRSNRLLAWATPWATVGAWPAGATAVATPPAEDSSGGRSSGGWTMVIRRTSRGSAVRRSDRARWPGRRSVRPQ